MGRIEGVAAMAAKKAVMRVGALGLLGGGAVLFAAQAGVLPGVELNQTASAPQASAPALAETIQAPQRTETSAALVAALGATPTPPVELSEKEPQVADTIPEPPIPYPALTEMPIPALPAASGFETVPEPSTPPTALAVEESPNLVRPAAFSPATILPMPRTNPPDVETEPEITPAELSPFGLPCGLDVTAEAGDAAIIALGVSAPCHAETAVTITHSGMTIAHRTDAFGLINLDLPALESPAFVTVTLPDGSSSDVILPVPGLADYDRVALAWQGDLGVELHVLEDGAAWMSDGHVRPEAPRDLRAAANGQGFMTLLGEADVPGTMQAQIYSAPRANGPTSTDISIDAPVTLANCTQTAEARLLHVTGGTDATMEPLSFTYPSCEAVGDTLVLQNVVGDLRLAAN